MDVKDEIEQDCIIREVELEEPYTQVEVDFPSQKNDVGADINAGAELNSETKVDGTDICEEIVIESDKKYCTEDIHEIVANDLVEEKSTTESCNNRVSWMTLYAPDAFRVWAEQERKKILNICPQLSNEKVSKRLIVEWRNLSNERKAPFIQKAIALKHLHAHRTQNRIQPKSVEGNKVDTSNSKEIDAAKSLATTMGSFSGSFSPSQAAVERMRRLNGFLVWVAHNRQKLKQMNPNSNITSTRSQDLLMWNSLTVNQQKPFIVKAMEIKSAFMRRHCQTKTKNLNYDQHKSFLKLSSDSNGDNNSKVIRNKENEEVIDITKSSSTVNGASLTLVGSNGVDNELLVADKGVTGITALENQSNNVIETSEVGDNTSEDSVTEVYLNEPDEDDGGNDVVHLFDNNINPVIVSVQSDPMRASAPIRTIAPSQKPNNQVDFQSIFFTPSYQLSPTEESPLYYSGYYVKHKNYYKLKPVLRKKAQRHYYDADKIKWHFIMNINKSPKSKSRNGAKAKDQLPSTTSRGVNSRCQQSANHLSRHTKQASVKKVLQTETSAFTSSNQEDVVEVGVVFDDKQADDVIEITEGSFDENNGMDVDNEATDVGADVSIIDDDPTQHVINIADSPNSSKKAFDLLNKDQEFVQFDDADSEEVAFTPRLFDEDESLSTLINLKPKSGQRLTLKEQYNFISKRNKVQSAIDKRIHSYQKDTAWRTMHNNAEKQRRIYLANAFEATYELVPDNFPQKFQKDRTTTLGNQTLTGSRNGKPSKMYMLRTLKKYCLHLVKQDATLAQQREVLASRNRTLTKKLIVLSKHRSLLRPSLIDT